MSSSKLESIQTNISDFEKLNISSIKYLSINKDNKDINIEKEKKFLEKLFIKQIFTILRSQLFRCGSFGSHNRFGCQL